jgi:redox-sensitive bicupin YhaK (pirin superfamily)
MQYLIHRASDRGEANFGWLKSFHSFSFGSYYDPNKMQFGALRVLNDDWVEAGAGFPTHGHRDMEIVSISLSGALKHEDSTGTAAVIHSGDVQVMSAGTGIEHSEYNASAQDPVAFLQIWVLPRERSVKPRYQQITLPQPFEIDRWVQLVSPNAHDEGVFVHQEAWFFMAELSGNAVMNYVFKRPETHGVYLFVIEGAIQVQDMVLSKRDAIGIWQERQFEVRSNASARVLAIEVPLLAK